MDFICRMTYVLPFEQNHHKSLKFQGFVSTQVSFSSTNLGQYRMILREIFTLKGIDSQALSCYTKT
jgi:hypothetical protein